MLNSNKNQNSSPEVLAAQTESTATEATPAVLDGSAAEGTSENGDDRRLDFSSSALSSKVLVSEREGVNKSEKGKGKGKGKKSSGERLQLGERKLKEKGGEVKELKDQKNTQEVTDLDRQLADREKEIALLGQQQPNAGVNKLRADLPAKEKDEEIKALKDQKNTQEVTDLDRQLADREKEIALLGQQQPNAGVNKLRADLTAKEKEVHKPKKENKELEAENKKIQQLKQGNAARYTPAVGMGLAVGLVAFTALERTVKLEMLVMIGIAVASALVAGGITYAVLPSTQVDGAKAQEVNEMGKRSNKG